LIKALVSAIRHVSLTTDEIHKLPDNYAIAAGMPGAHTSLDPAKPERAFLPKDLPDDGGEWLALEPRNDQPLAAPMHFVAFAAKSAFDLHLWVASTPFNSISGSITTSMAPQKKAVERSAWVRAAGHSVALACW
jgi:hypothetical protein